MMIGELIKTWREQQGITLRQLAKTIGIDYGALWRLERNEQVKDSQWKKIMLWLILTEPKPVETTTTK